MIAQYQDAMTIVSKYGKPDIFLTFTCNPSWDEIQRNLSPNQSASDRPDLIARVFNLKVKALCHELFKKKALGEVSAYIYVIEFQKRGLPHMHMLITLKGGWKMHTAANVDSLISAELPCSTDDNELFEIVSKNMIHRPCGLLNPSSPCMKNGSCSKRFPKPFRAETSLSVDGYPEYRRRNDGRSVTCRGTSMDNRFVVPYSPYLTRMFRAHINVEVCALLHVVKYVYKYVYKGSDRARVRLSQTSDDATTHDEIISYIDARYVCAPEAIHRIFGFKMHARSVSVVRLQIHLPGFETVCFVEGAEQQALDNASARVSTLTAYFAKNQACLDLFRLHGSLPAGLVDSRNYHYFEIPEHFVYQNGWTERERGARTIGRMYFVGPADSERFALRLLLLYGKGFTSFSDVLTVDDIEHPSFVAAARAAGYLSDDSYFEQSMREAAAFHLPAQLRSYYVSLLIFGEVQPPVPLRL
ncbi:unnamed protein product [Heligmosomoides polygyrus]|uniref:Helitron_like_N domain-containing protein n=1 Tax=Heligmosomoides polygyrus TaxID=6339 RepID=A0A183G6L5_HELPZ|nr:unnamed protein product [Heligmosomoides polygyrus]